MDAAAKAASDAFPAWRRTPAQERVQYLFKLRDLMKANMDEIARLITNECGKTFDESKAEMVRAIENVEVACGIPMMSKGEISEDIAPGIDEIMLRQPVGVCATIAPFNFPGMIPFWYLPYALACGNTYIVKPSEKVPMTMQFIFKLIEQVGFPKGVINLVNGAKEAVDGILDHPEIRAITFVGSSNVAKYIYSRASANGKRVQAQGGAKNPVVVLPDADMDMAVKIIADSAFGCAGQRCLAVSWAVTVGEARNQFNEAICDAAATRKVGYGLDDGYPDGSGHQSAEQSAHRAVDRAWVRPKEQRCRLMDAERSSRDMKAELCSSDHPDGHETRQRDLEDGDLRSGVGTDARQHDRRGDCTGEQPGVWQPGQPVHSERVGGAEVPLRGGCREYRYQHRGGCTDGFLPLQRLEGIVSLATCTDRAWMRWSSSPRRKWSLSAGQRNGRENSRQSDLKGFKNH